MATGLVSFALQNDNNTFLESGAVWTTQMRVMNDCRLHKGLAFTIQERQVLGIHGLLPAAVQTQDQQVHIVLENFYRLTDDLDRYIYMMGLQERNEKLFYRVCTDYTELMLPVVYTPTVGLACQKYGVAYRKPRGLFITVNDEGHVYDILCNWPEPEVRAICVTDGERILGLGDLGAHGMGIPVGKLALYTVCARIKPQYCLPITLDVGTNNQTLLKDPMYIGLRKMRVDGKKYDRLLDEFMAAVVKRYGQDTLIQFEDFGNKNAFRLLEKYRSKYCTFNDDIQGTAGVALAGLLTAARITKIPLRESVILFFGAGEAAIGIAKLILEYLYIKEGCAKDESLKNIWLVDSNGLLVKNRPAGGVTGEKVYFAKDHAPLQSLEDIVDAIRPNTLIGAAAIPKVFTERILRKMAIINRRPVVLALSNPTSKCECSAEEAYTYTEGRAVFATGSPFPPFWFNGKTFYTSQGNNAYIFPGVALGVISCGLKHVEEEVFLIAAKEVAAAVEDKDMDEGRIYPKFNKIHMLSFDIAKAIVKYAYANKMASHYPEPEDKGSFVRRELYSTTYDDFMPSTYEWGEDKNEDSKTPQ